MREAFDDEYLLEALRTYDRSVAQWDAEPRLYSMATEPSGVRFRAVSPSLVPDWREIEERDRPYVLIGTVMAGLALRSATSPTLFGNPCAAGWVGWAYVYQSWGFERPHRHECSSADDCAYAQWEADGKSAADHPEGVEYRSLLGVSAAGGTVALARMRGDTEAGAVKWKDFDGRSPEQLQLSESLTLLAGVTAIYRRSSAHEG